MNMAKLTLVFTVLGQHEMAELAIQHALRKATLGTTRVVVLDNGGDFNPHVRISDERLAVYNLQKNIGVYPVFDWGMKNTTSEIVAFLHSDLIIDEQGYDARIVNEFVNRPSLGLIGFVGSNEIDHNGGRGGGTTSNFLGKTYIPEAGEAGYMFTGSPAEAHGMRNAGFTDAAVVDGCAMVIRRDAWKEIGFRENFPPHHFYDRLISTQMLEKGFKVGVLGIGCDHLGGQTVSKEQRYPDMAEEWCRKNVKPDRFVGNPPAYSWDLTVYREAEFQWLREYRDRKHIVPTRV